MCPVSTTICTTFKINIFPIEWSRKVSVIAQESEKMSKVLWYIIETICFLNLLWVAVGVDIKEIGKF